MAEIAGNDPYAGEKRPRLTEATAALSAMYSAAKVDVVRNVGAGQVRGALPSRWRGRLKEIVGEQGRRTATLLAVTTVNRLGGDVNGFDSSRMDDYLDVFAEGFSRAWDEATNQALDAIDLRTDDLVVAAGFVMDAVAAQAPNDALDVIQRSANFGVTEGGKYAGATVKTWITGSNARATHAAQNGVSVPMGERFPNGLRYPGAPGPPQEVANCNCSLTVGRAP